VSNTPGNHGNLLKIIPADLLDTLLSLRIAVPRLCDIYGRGAHLRFLVLSRQWANTQCYAPLP